MGGFPIAMLVYRSVILGPLIFMTFFLGGSGTGVGDGTLEFFSMSPTGENREENHRLQGRAVLVFEEGHPNNCEGV